MYRISYKLTNLTFMTSKPILVEIILAQAVSTGQLVLESESYLNLGTPSFVALSFEDIKTDLFLKGIAQILLDKKYPMLS